MTSTILMGITATTVATTATITIRINHTTNGATIIILVIIPITLMIPTATTLRVLTATMLYQYAETSTGTSGVHMAAHAYTSIYALRVVTRSMEHPHVLPKVKTVRRRTEID